MKTLEKENTKFELVSDFTPAGDQPQAIKKLVKGLADKDKYQTLLGVTGSGKTFTIANVIEKTGRPTLVMAPNKTLAAQLYGEFKDLFPNNAVEYFVSYYDYYQPEAYVSASDTFIEKDASINDEIDKLRHSATHSLLTRKDVIIVSSVSCIYGIGSPDDYSNMKLYAEKDMDTERDSFLKRLVEMQYKRNDTDFHRGTFRVRGDVVEVFPAYEAEKALRFEFFGDTVDEISEIDPLRGKVIRRLKNALIHPASHFASTRGKMRTASESIRAELQLRLKELSDENKQVEYQRLEQRTLYDLEMIEEMGYCSGIENYSRHLTGRLPGEPPFTLIDYFDENFLMVLDESHIMASQVGAMYSGDRSRKENLVGYGFRLPSALDNRPLKFEEFEKRVNQAIFVSATPGNYELEASGGVIVEQIIRPTGLLDPVIEIRPATHQVDDLLGEVNKTIDAGNRVLVTTLTKRNAEDLTEYYTDLDLRVKYLHSDVETLDRIEIIKDLRLGKFDVLIGINLLREGLDLPEVSLVAIFDADKEGFLRSERSLIQTFGRAARNVDGRVILYADKMTRSMRAAIDETERRKQKQIDHNKANDITPKTIKSKIKDSMKSEYQLEYSDGDGFEMSAKEDTAAYGTSNPIAAKDIPKKIKELKKEMQKAAKELDFETAADLRDDILKLEHMELGIVG